MMFTASWRRLAVTFQREADAYQRSWLFMEGTRVAHDTLLSIMAAIMLVLLAGGLGLIARSLRSL